MKEQINKAILLMENNILKTSGKQGILHRIENLNLNDCYKICLQALQNELSREENKPLTLDELKEMVDKPVYQVPKLGSFLQKRREEPQWIILKENHLVGSFFYGQSLFFKHEPKELEYDNQASTINFKK